MASSRFTHTMLIQLPKYIAARSIHPISSIYLPSRTIKIPARYDLLKKAASDRLLLNWFENAWSKTKSQIIDNWESAGLIKKRKPGEDYRSATTTISKALKTDKSGVDNVNKELTSKSDKATDELTKAKNKAQRHLAEDWDAVNRVNSRTNEKLVDNVKERTTSTIDDLSKSVKENRIVVVVRLSLLHLHCYDILFHYLADSLIDKTTNDIKSKINDKGDDLKEKISK